MAPPMHFTHTTPPGHTAVANHVVDCWSCGVQTTLLTALHGIRTDGTTIMFGICACPKQEPMLVTRNLAGTSLQAPPGQPMKPGDRWPAEMARLFTESAAAFGAGAFTASAMASRKILMACACREGAKEGGTFKGYVEYITTSVLPFPRAAAAISKIKDIGNDANHDLEFVTHDDAKTALGIVTYLLNTIYSFPTA